MNFLFAPPVVLEPPITWSEDVLRRRRRPTWEVNQSRNPTASDHLVRRVYCEPTRSDGSRVIKYMLDGSDVSVNLPRSAYRCSLDDLLPLEVERAPWMKLTRHPLIWDGQVRPPLTGDYFKIVELIPLEDSDDWRRSMESVGLHWLPEHTSETERPPYDLNVLVRLAIMGSPNQIISKPEMEELLITKFPWFKAHRYRTVGIPERRGNRRPPPIVSPWPYDLGQMLSAGQLHQWLRPHPFPQTRPGAITRWYIDSISFKSGSRPRARLIAAEVHHPPSSQGSSHGSPAILDQFEAEVSQSVYTSATPPPGTPVTYADIFEGSLSSDDEYPSSLRLKEEALTPKVKYAIRRKERHPFLFHRLLERLRIVGIKIDERKLDEQRRRFVDADQEADPAKINQTEPNSGSPNQIIGANSLPRSLSEPAQIVSHGLQHPSLPRTESVPAVRRKFHLSDLREATFLKAIIKKVTAHISSLRSGKEEVTSGGRGARQRVQRGITQRKTTRRESHNAGNHA